MKSPDISPRTPRECLLTEVAHLQGLQQGFTTGVQTMGSQLKSIVDILIDMRREALVKIEQLEPQTGQQGRENR